MTDWQQIETKYYMQTFNRLPIIIEKGEGCYVWDNEGKRYLDLVAGWAVNCLGHCPPVVIDAVSNQVRKLIQTSNSYYTIPQLELAQLLINHSVFDRVFFCNSGAEATEGAVKLARRYGKRFLDGAYEVITVSGSFHGRTLAMVSASAQVKHQLAYTPLPSGFINVDFNNPDVIERSISQKTCAIMLEPIQGEGGVNLPDEGYLNNIRSICDRTGILLIFDEVQTGIGRVGNLFAYQEYGVEPDIITLAKGLGSGIPIGAILAKEKAAVFVIGEHGSTFGGNPLTCAAAHAVVKYIIENDIAGNSRRMGNYFLKKLNHIHSKVKAIINVRGKGLLIAIEFKDDIAEQLTLTCLKKGLLINKVKPNTIRFIPPLIISKEEIDEAMAIFESCLTDTSFYG